MAGAALVSRLTIYQGDDAAIKDWSAGAVDAALTSAAALQTSVTIELWTICTGKSAPVKRTRKSKKLWMSSLYPISDQGARYEILEPRRAVHSQRVHHNVNG